MTELEDEATAGGDGDDVAEFGIDHEDADEEDFDQDGFDEAPPGRRRWIVVGLVVLVLVLAGAGIAFGLALSGGSAPRAGPEGMPIQPGADLASADSTRSGAAVDGVTCRTASEEVVKYHIHTLVKIFVDGQPQRIPAGAGIAAPRQQEHLANGLFDDNGLHGCLYWIHTHSNDGVIHVEAPAKGVFTLGQFFDIWQQPLSATQVGPASGAVTAYENGKRLTGNPRDIPLRDLGVIQLDVGSPAVPFQPQKVKVNGLCGSGTAGCATSG